MTGHALLQPIPSASFLCRSEVKWSYNRPRNRDKSEAASSLDMVNKAMILKLLRDLKETYDLAYLFITHDVQAAQALSDQFMILD